MNMQEVAVYVIIACAVFAIGRYVYRQIVGKNNGCNCGSCPKNGGKCHCCDTQN